jgi:DNA polymerase-1
VENAEKIRISRELVTLKADTPLDVTWTSWKSACRSRQTIMDFLTRMEFRTLTKRVADKLGIAAPALPETSQLTVSAPSEEPAAGAGRTACPSTLPPTNASATWRR